MMPGGVLLDRSAELARLRHVVASAAVGVGGSVLIEGESGSGKTALVREAVRLAEDAGFRVLQASGSTLERGYPFGVVRQWLDPVLRRAGPEERQRLAEGRAANALAAIDPGASATEAPVALLDGLHWMLAALADDCPVLATVDDAQWADPDSLQVLGYLVPRLQSSRMTLVVSTRLGELDHPGLSHALAAGAERLQPGPLSAGAVRTLVADTLGEEGTAAFVAACHEATGGNAFLVRALLDELRRTATAPTDASASRVGLLGPRAVSTAVVARLALLPEGAVEVARSLSVLGDGALRGELASMTGLDQDEVTAMLDDLDRIGLVTADDDPSFVHAITQNAVYGDMGRALRATMHRRAAAVLQERRAPVERVVAHVLATGSPLDVEHVAIVRAAADEALRRGAVVAAIDHLRRALPACEERGSRFEVLRDLGIAELRVDGPAAVGHLSEALEAADAPHDRLTVASALSRALFFADQPETSAAVAVQAAEAAEQLGDPDVVHRMEALQLAPARVEPSLGLVRKTRLESFHLGGLRSDGPGARALVASVNYQEARALAVDASVAVERARWALEDDLLAGADNGGTDFMATVLVLLAADAPTAVDVLQRGMAAATAAGDVFAFAGCSLFLGQALFQRGDLADAAAAVEAGIAASIEYGVGIVLPWGTGILAMVQDASGDCEQAAQTLRRASESGDVPDNAIWHPFALARARVLLSTGDAPAAVEAALDCGRRYARVEGANPAMIPWRSLAAEAVVAAGADPERARVLAAEEIELARRWGAPRALGHALRIGGSVSETVDLPCLEESVSVLEASCARLDLAHSLVALGAAIRRSGQRAAARPHLTRGLAIARSCGAVPLATHAADELAAAGGRPGRAPTSGLDALTPSERRVAALAASGLTNRAIAQRLFVTQKTVEFHLGQTFRKLGVGRRTELAVHFPDVSTGASSALDG